MEEKKQDDLPVFEWFKTHVISSKLDPSIGHDELVSYLFTAKLYKSIILLYSIHAYFGISGNTSNFTY